MLSFKSRALKSTIKYSIKRLNQRPKKKTFRWKNFLIETKLKLKQNRLSLMVSFLFWFSGFMYYFFVEPCPPTASSPLSCYFHTFFVSLTIRNPTVQSDWSRFYDLVWPIFLEVVVFGLVATALLDQYNPVLVARLTSEHQSFHTVVIGYQHLAEKIVDFLRHHQRPFVVIDENQERVSELLQMNEPVVVGNPVDQNTFKSANIQDCKEVFIVLNNLHTAIIACFHVRSFNKLCRIYVQVFEHDEFQDFFAQDPLNAFTFSTSRWAVKSVLEWIKETPENKEQQEKLKCEKKKFKPRASFMLPKSLHDSEEEKSDTEATSFDELIKVREDWLKKFKERHTKHSASTSQISESNSPEEPQKQESPTQNSIEEDVGEGYYKNPVIVIVGSSNIARRVIKELTKEKRKVYWVDQSLDDVGDQDVDNKQTRSKFLQTESISKTNISLIQIPQRKLAAIDKYVPFQDCSHLFICWNNEKYFSNIIVLVMLICKTYPHVKVHVQMYDETLADIIESLGGFPFSTSTYAFEMLQKEVSPTSGISLALEN